MNVRTPRVLRALLAALALVAALVFAACGETQDDQSSSVERDAVRVERRATRSIRTRRSSRG